MAAAAQFFGKDGVDDANDLIIFFAENGLDIHFLRFLKRQLVNSDREPFPDLPVDHILDRKDLLFGKVLIMIKIKAQVFVADERPLLADMGTENATQTLVKQVSRSMVSSHAGTELRIDFEFHPFADGETIPSQLYHRSVLKVG